MELKEKVLRRLESSRGEYLSGEQLAKDCGVSRNAVWKCVRALKEDGIQIGSVRNRGYVLLAESDALTACGVEKFLKHEFSLTVLKSTGSTNDEVKALANAGAPEWTAVLAEEQSAGRGRYRRPFDSPAGSGVYVSILLRPKFSAAETLFITACAAVAVCDAIAEVAKKEAAIKWVNDIFLNGRKVCGILTEASFDVESGGLAYAVVGIGVNVKDREFPKELAGVADSVFGEGEYPAEGRARIAAAILERFRTYYEQIPARTFFAEYKRRSFVIGRRVLVCSGNLEEEADVLDLDENCFLRVRFADGRERLLSAGEVRLRLV